MTKSYKLEKILNFDLSFTSQGETLTALWREKNHKMKGFFKVNNYYHIKTKPSKIEKKDE